eukprot:TRINITY_DN3617_c0_g1_i1.p1 TRINITY_DN3617_c0_g1~~TRINITY_DN3617_c0_g1_i1.p1  ORF type:complete len:313 (-),score=66.65 TRINITY_DN3617_c0_g1_i1:56-994(-)
MSLTDKLWGIEGIMSTKLLEEELIKEDYIQGTTQFYRLYCACMGPWLPVKDQYISEREEKVEPKSTKKREDNNASSNNNTNYNYDTDGWPPLPASNNDNIVGSSNTTAGRTSPTLPPLSKTPHDGKRVESAFPRRQATMPSLPNAHANTNTNIPTTPVTNPSTLPPMRNSLILERGTTTTNTTTSTTSQTPNPNNSPSLTSITTTLTTPSINATPYSSINGNSYNSSGSANVNSVSTLPPMRHRHSSYNLTPTDEFEPQQFRTYEKRRYRHAVSRGGSLPIKQISFSPTDVTYISSGKGPPFFSMPERSKPR